MSARAGDLEWELEAEIEGEGEAETEEEMEGEAFLGNIGQVLGGLLGEGEVEGESEWEAEFEGEEFFRRAFRGVRGFVRRAAPMLKGLAKVAAPLVGTAVGGPLGGMLGKAAVGLLGEGEFEAESEWEAEAESEWEAEAEAEFEAEGEAPSGAHEAMAEMMAAVASQAQTEAEAEAMIGAATVTVLTARERAALRRVLPHMVRGTAILARILRPRTSSRPAMRVIPTVVRQSSRILLQGAAAGQPVTRQRAARVMARQVRRVLGDPGTCAHALRRNVVGTRMIRRPRYQPNPRRYARPYARPSARRYAAGSPARLSKSSYRY
jgi:hypothetical protein